MFQSQFFKSFFLILGIIILASCGGASGTDTGAGGSGEGTGGSSGSASTDYACTTDDDCFTDWGLAKFTCENSFDSPNYSSSCEGYSCSDDGYCNYSGGGSGGELCNETESFANIGGACTGECSSMDSGDWFFARSGPDGYCEQTYRCSDSSDCTGDDSCFIDGHCITQSALDDYANGTCDPSVGCAQDSEICLPVISSSGCSHYCLNNSSFGVNSENECDEDADCESSPLELIGYSCYKTMVNTGEEELEEIGKCIDNDVSECN